jgi:hypothetical protein
MLHEPSKIRIADGTISGEHVVQLLEDMAKEAHDAGLEGSHVAISYIEEDDDFVPGTYVPEIHLVLRQVADE